MGLTVGELFVRLKADQSALDQGLDEARRKSSDTAASMGADWDNFKSKLSSVGTVMTAAVTLPILGAGTAAVNLASDLSETMNKIDVVFKDNAQEVKDWASTSIEKMGLAKQTALDMTALYGDMGTSMGFTTKAAADMGRELTQRAADLASFKNIQIDVAKTALNGIFSGETESLKQLGVVMTVANLENFALEKGLKKTYDQMSQNEQVTLRYQYVMEKTSNAAGDFARTSDGVANQTRMAGEQIKELGASMGEILLPAAAALLKGVNELIKGFIDLPDSQKQTIVTILGITAAIGPAIKVFSLLNKAGEASTKMFQAIGKISYAAQMRTVTSANTAAAASANALALANAKTAASEAALQLVTAKAAAAKAAYALATLQATAGATAEQIAAAKAVATQTALAVSAAQAAVAETTLGVASAGAAVGTTAGGVAAAVATPPVMGLGAAIQFALGPLAIIGGLLAIAIPLLTSLGSESGKANAKFKSLMEDVAASKQAFEDSAEATQTDAEAATRLASRLDELSKKTNLTKLEKIELRQIVNQLNDLYPDLGLVIDKVTGKLNMETGAIKTLIAEKKKQAMMSIYEDRMTELLKEQIALEDQLTAKTKEQTAAYEEMMKPHGFEFHFAWEEDAFEKYGRLNKEIGDVNTALNDNAAAMTDIEGKYTQSVEAMTETTEVSAATLKEQQEALEEYNKNVEDEMNNHLEQMGGIYDKSIEQNKTSAKQVQKNLEKQIEQFTTWREEIKKLAGKVPEDVLTELEKLGPESTTLIKDLNKKNPKDLQEFVDVWQEKGRVAKEAAIEELGGVVGETAAVVTDAAAELQKTEEIKSDAEQLGMTIVNGLITGMNARAGTLKLVARSIASQALGEMRNQIQPGSPSKVTTVWGRNMPEGLALGMQQKSDLPVRAARDISQDTLTAISGAGTTTRRAAALAAEASSALNTPRSSSTRVQHSGTIRVEGINSKGDLEAVVDVIMDRLQVEHLQAGLR